MTRALPETGRLLLVFVVVTAVTLAGCRRRAAEVAEYRDPHPLAEDPLVVDAPSLGKHGGRFVFAETGNPTGVQRVDQRTGRSRPTSRITTSLRFSFTTTTPGEKAGSDDCEVVRFVRRRARVDVPPSAWLEILRRPSPYVRRRAVQRAGGAGRVAAPVDAGPLKIDGKPLSSQRRTPHAGIIRTQTPFATMPISAGALKIVPKHVLKSTSKSSNFTPAYNVSTPPGSNRDERPLEKIMAVASRLRGPVLGATPYWFGVDEANKRLPLRRTHVPARTGSGCGRFEVPRRRVMPSSASSPRTTGGMPTTRKPVTSRSTASGRISTAGFWFNLNKVQPPL